MLKNLKTLKTFNAFALNDLFALDLYRHEFICKKYSQPLYYVRNALVFL